jgi:hypothetical protein
LEVLVLTDGLDDERDADVFPPLLLLLLLLEEEEGEDEEWGSVTKTMGTSLELEEEVVESSEAEEDTEEATSEGEGKRLSLGSEEELWREGGTAGNLAELCDLLEDLCIDWPLFFEEEEEEDDEDEEGAREPSKRMEGGEARERRGN